MSGTAPGALGTSMRPPKDQDRPLTIWQATIMLLRRRGGTVQEVATKLRTTPTRVVMFENKALHDLPQTHALQYIRRIIYNSIRRMAA